MLSFMLLSVLLLTLLAILGLHVLLNLMWVSPCWLSISDSWLDGFDVQRLRVQRVRLINPNRSVAWVKI
ncbi:predicted protein [Histoplasma mississippiense (nom. inval.)]|uniref:predicted protein n=1 Tax=Ajellomyces capsulatus (strain NAm1 / WU24) TaxID=2059318 RepID=UPI000157BFF1|nr:predicted protein [Histoplasma mississippiense (nom. inval.)]XP_001535863.1 predicted protein [Histoplasma mississippiense (nom. inval.)]XP_001535872.1 predicted protein [Histoplasma mississippiense (nom. inval.)]XP_001541031.1 predicted protein [Histoplasma mississippiense (nom. inval.)]EDN04918.1 predicted protein [Histoplasma mississippiense (nom. inval.)]EDN06598.1 predicted protein [Histoplasma mississippiense (nom. inval.)]EDN07511.1 predicted protein [Histoplasma mississippiense (no